MINDYQNFMKVIPLPCLVVKPSKKGFIIENSNQEHEKLIRKKIRISVDYLFQLFSC